MRPKGTVVYRTPEQPEVKALEQEQRQDREQRRVAAIERRESRVLLNKHTYAWLYEEYQARVATGGTTKLHQCKRCEATLHWEEPAHVCPGFTPKYVEHDQDWHERQDARREEKRASKTKIVTCDGCGAELPTLEDAQWHEEYCVTDEVRAERHQTRLQARYAHHTAVNGDEDDLSGYEDEPEEDYCEGDDDGYDCD